MVERTILLIAHDAPSVISVVTSNCLGSDVLNTISPATNGLPILIFVAKRSAMLPGGLLSCP